MRIFFGTIWQFPAPEKLILCKLVRKLGQFFFSTAKLHREYILANCDKVSDIIEKGRGFVTVRNDYQLGYSFETEYK